MASGDEDEVSAAAEAFAALSDQGSEGEDYESEGDQDGGEEHDEWEVESTGRSEISLDSDLEENVLTPAHSIEEDAALLGEDQGLILNTSVQVVTFDNCRPAYIHQCLQSKDGRFYEVHFQGCKLGMLNLDNCLFFNVKFENCVFGQTSFSNIFLRSVSFINCDFRNYLWQNDHREGAGEGRMQLTENPTENHIGDTAPEEIMDRDWLRDELDGTHALIQALIGQAQQDAIPHTWNTPHGSLYDWNREIREEEAAVWSWDANGGSGGLIYPHRQAAAAA